MPPPVEVSPVEAQPAQTVEEPVATDFFADDLFATRADMADADMADADAADANGADDAVDAEEGEPSDPSVLPTRIPGSNLSQVPAPTVDASPIDASPIGSDPMRPYRVHELLSRHEQGKQRGRADVDVLVTEDRVPESE